MLQTERYGEFTYTIPNLTAGGAYAVTLYFVESYWTAAGQRTFDVAVNGATVLTAFDIFAAAGGANKAIAQTFNAVASSAGEVTIAFTRGGGPDNPKICGIRVGPGSVSQTYTLTIAGGAGGATSPAAGTYTYAAGAAVAVTALPASGYAFAGWSGAATGTANPVTVTLDADKTLTAGFNELPPSPPSTQRQAYDGARGKSFNDGWRFYRGDPSGAQQPGFNDAGWRSLSVPHDWSIELPFNRSSAAGAGKSTLINLVPRFYDVTGGRVLVDGQDVRQIQQDSLLAHIAIVPQDTVLFSGSVRDNIRYGNPEACDDEVIAAADAAQAHDFILGLPNGYDTHIEERGVNLSGGQKQRLAIARALLTHPRILILDDSTSSVDVETETKIQDALEGQQHGQHTSLVVAQRISTVLKADKIIVIDEIQRLPDLLSPELKQLLSNVFQPLEVASA